jgi:hypothetical protein
MSMDYNKIFKSLKSKFKNKYHIHDKSIHEAESKLFFLMKRGEKFFVKARADRSFKLTEQIEDSFNIDIDNSNADVKILGINKSNSKKFSNIFRNLFHIPINRKAYLGFGDRIKIAGNIHSEISKNYDIFPIFF